MSKASISMIACGIYLVFGGIAFLFFPEIVLSSLLVFTPPDVMSRMCGMIFLIFSYIYIRTGIKDEGMEFFYLLTAQERFTPIIFLIVFYFMGFAEWPIIIFGLIDLGFGLWTLIALRLDRSKKKG
jgi:hypothetical protein